MCARVCAHVCVCVCAHTHVCVCVCARARARACACVCMRACVRVCSLFCTLTACARIVLAQESTPSEAVQLTELRKDLKRAREDGESQNRVIGELKSKVAQIEEQLEAVTATNLELEKAKAALVRIACLRVGLRYIGAWMCMMSN